MVYQRAGRGIEIQLAADPALRAVHVAAVSVQPPLHLYDHTVFVTYSLSFMMLLVIAGGLWSRPA